MDEPKKMSKLKRLVSVIKRRRKPIPATAITPDDPDMPKFREKYEGGRILNKNTGEESTNDEYYKSVDDYNQSLRDKYGYVPDYKGGRVVNKETEQEIPTDEYNRRKWEEYKKKRKK